MTLQITFEYFRKKPLLNIRYVVYLLSAWSNLKYFCLGRCEEFSLGLFKVFDWIHATHDDHIIFITDMNQFSIFFWTLRSASEWLRFEQRKFFIYFFLMPKCLTHTPTSNSEPYCIMNGKDMALFHFSFYYVRIFVFIAHKSFLL